MSNVVADDLADLLNRCRHIRKLSLESVDVNSRVLTAIGKNLDLQVLHLSMARGVTTKGILNCFPHLSWLLELNISWTGLTTPALNALVESLPAHLARLNISGMRETLTDRHIEMTALKCPDLKELDISDNIKLTADTLDVVASNFHRLESLSSSRCYAIALSNTQCSRRA